MHARATRKRKIQENDKLLKENSETQDINTSNKSPDGVPYKRILIRLLVAVSCMVFARYYFGPPGKDYTLVHSDEITNYAFFPVTCSDDYDLEEFKGCVPVKCGRVVMDNVITTKEAKGLLRIALNGLSHGGSNGGASILDLHSGALSRGDKFINIYRLIEETKEKIFSDDDFHLYRRVKNKIHNLVAEEFGISPVQTKLHLTSPTFFSQMTMKPARTVHDEYWHPHVDKETYGSFHYTSLLYLSTFNEDFTGGRFTFMDKDANRTIEPRLGRLSFFTSGSENIHFVEPLQSGARYAVTISFTCDPKKAISDPRIGGSKKSSKQTVPEGPN